MCIRDSTSAAQVIDAIGFVGLIYQEYASGILLAYQYGASGRASTDMSVLGESKRAGPAREYERVPARVAWRASWRPGVGVRPAHAS